MQPQQCKENEIMDSPTDWLPPSGQQATQTHIVTTPSPPDPPHPDYKRRQPPTPDLHPSPITQLDSSGERRISTWAGSVGESPRTTSALSDGKRLRKPQLPVIRKISNIQPGQNPEEPEEAGKGIKLQANGLALPQRVIFDPWNACTTGHQRAENRLSGSTSWRENRESKLKNQFADGTGSGGKRLADTVGAGAEDFGKDGRTANGGWVKGAPGLRRGGQKSIVNCFRAPTMVDDPTQQTVVATGVMQEIVEEVGDWQDSINLAPSYSSASTIGPSINAPTTKIFQNTCIYINGSTMPIISDHLLRQLIIQNGGALSIALARRSVSHVILTHKPTDSSRSAGGGLANQKVRKEVERKRAVGVGVKYVTAHWIIESVKACKRLPEGRFADWRFVERGQEDVRGFFSLGKDDAGLVGKKS